MLISVVIPHFNQEDYLATGLQRLHAQESVTADVEIIVVDNGSRRMPEAVCAAWPKVRLLKESTPGPGPARNCGAAVASGDVLAFIDADCHAHPGWLAAIEKAFADPETQIIGGDVRVGYVDPANPTFLEPYESIYSYRNHEHIAEGFSGTGNLATRPEILAHVGPFAGIGVAEDRDWGLRAGALGYKIAYVPAMIVYHPARKSFAELTQKWDRHISHDYAHLGGRSFGRLRWLLRAAAIAVSPLAEIPTVLRSARVSGLRERYFAFLCLCRIRLYRGYAMVKLMFDKTSHQARSDWHR